MMGHARSHGARPNLENLHQLIEKADAEIIKVESEIVTLEARRHDWDGVDPMLMPQAEARKTDAELRKKVYQALLTDEAWKKHVEIYTR